jgi:hypothetical protein
VITPLIVGPAHTDKGKSVILDLTCMVDMKKGAILITEEKRKRTIDH